MFKTFSDMVKTTIITHYVYKLNVPEGIKYTLHNTILHFEYYTGSCLRLMLKYKEIYHGVTTELHNYNISSTEPHYNILS
jgi:hypothetical protein